MLEVIVEVLKWVFVLLLLYQVIIRILSKTLRRYIQVPAPAFLGRILDSRIRRRLQSPVIMIQRSGIKRGMRVMDLGCGSGAFTFFLARAVGPKGKVYAVDIQSKMLKQLVNKLRREENSDVRNVIELVNASASDLPFADNTVDACCMITVLQEIPDRIKALNEIKRILKTEGILAVSELFIDPDYPLKSTTIRLGEETGFITESVIGSFWNYTVRFRKCSA